MNGRISRPYRAGVLLRWFLPAFALLTGLGAAFIGFFAVVILLNAVLADGNWLGFSIVLGLMAGFLGSLAVSSFRFSRTGLWTGPLGVELRVFGQRPSIWSWEAFVEASPTVTGGRESVSVRTTEELRAVPQLATGGPLLWGGSDVEEICGAVNASRS